MSIQPCKDWPGCPCANTEHYHQVLADMVDETKPAPTQREVARVLLEIYAILVCTTLRCPDWSLRLSARAELRKPTYAEFLEG